MGPALALLEGLRPAYFQVSKVVATMEELTADKAAWLARYRPAAPEKSVDPEPSARDELREILALRAGAKLDPLKTKGRLILYFKKPAEARAALAAVLAIA